MAGLARFGWNPIYVLIGYLFLVRTEVCPTYVFMINKDLIVVLIMLGYDYVNDENDYD